MSITGDNKIPLKKTAIKLSIAEYKIDEVVQTFFQAITDDIESGEYRGSYCRKFGKFIVKPKRVEHMKKVIAESKLKKEKLKNGNISTERE